MTRHVGAHVSISRGPQQAPLRAAEIGATALGMFTKNQRQWRSPPMTEEDADQFTANLEAAGLSPDQVLVHSSYLINVANPDPGKRERARAALLDEAQRVEALGLTLLNFHPGSGLGDIADDEAIELISEAMRQVLEKTQSARLVVEATAGQGAHVGRTFAQLAAIIDGTGGSSRVGVCIDTCHVFAAGYDLRTDEAYEEMMEEFARTIGFDRLAGVHINDSRSDFASRHDRHESIGIGRIGLAGLCRILTDTRIPDVPFILETPRPELWQQEIALLQGVASGEVDPEHATIPAALEKESERPKKGKKSG